MDFDVAPELTSCRRASGRSSPTRSSRWKAIRAAPPHGPTEELRRELVALGARRGAAVAACRARIRRAGAVACRQGRSCSRRPATRCSGPVAMNIFAPDEGNMHLLEAVATPAQKERWLRPLAAGDIRSCFCMTEPAPGAGSDPSMLDDDRDAATATTA